LAEAPPRGPRRARLSCVDLAAVAAFTAAGLALVGVVVNIVWSYRLSSRVQLEQWRRNEERPIVARMLTLSADVLEQWQQTGQARRDWIDSLRADPNRGHEDTKARDEARDHWGAGSELYEKLRFGAAQLDLIAGRPLRSVAAKLVREHESAQHWLRPASGADDWFELLTEQNNKIVRLHAELVGKDSCRPWSRSGFRAASLARDALTSRPFPATCFRTT
jgi:hypothetical protein